MRSLASVLVTVGLSVGCGEPVSADLSESTPPTVASEPTLEPPAGFEIISHVESAPGIEIGTVYPQMTGRPSAALDAMNQVIKASFLNPYRAYRDDNFAWMAERVKEVKALGESMGQTEYQSQHFSHTISHISPEIVSIRGRVYSSGGAHGNWGFFPVNYWWRDSQAKEIHLADLFDPTQDWRAILEPIVCYALAEASMAKAEKGGERSIEQWLERYRSITTEKLLGAPFTFSEKGIEFYYAPYVVAAFAAGDFHAIIPIERIDNILSADGPMASWLR